MHNNATISPTRDTELILLASAGDCMAFDHLVRHYRPVLLGLTFLRTRDLCEAEDLVQEILLRVWQKLPRLNIPALFLPWMKTIAAKYLQHLVSQTPRTNDLARYGTRQSAARGWRP